MFASHYDEGRITRMLAPDPLWAELGRRAIHAYLEIERESGLQFFHPGGCLKVAPDTPQFAELHASLEAVRDRLNLTTWEVPEGSLLRPEAFRIPQVSETRAA